MNRRIWQRPARGYAHNASVRKERGTSPEYPDIPPQYPSYYPRGGGRPPESQHDIERIAEEHSREEAALQRDKKPSFWKRLLGRGGDPSL